MAGITSFGLNSACGGTGGVFRTDRANVLHFINGFMAEDASDAAAVPTAAGTSRGSGSASAPKRGADTGPEKSADNGKKLGLAKR